MALQSGTPLVIPGLLAFRSQQAATANLAPIFDLFANLLPPYLGITTGDPHRRMLVQREVTHRSGQCTQVL